MRWLYPNSFVHGATVQFIAQGRKKEACDSFYVFKLPEAIVEPSCQHPTPKCTMKMTFPSSKQLALANFNLLYKTKYEEMSILPNTIHSVDKAAAGLCCCTHV